MPSVRWHAARTRIGLLVLPIASLVALTAECQSTKPSPSGSGGSHSEAGTGLAGAGRSAGRGGTASGGLKDMATDAGAGGAMADPPLAASGDAPCDSAIWSPVPGANACNKRSADVSQWCVPARKWKSCGNGCLVAPAGLLAESKFNRVLRGAVSAGYVQGELWLRTVEVNEKLDDSSDFTAVTRIRDDAVVGAVLTSSSDPQCSFVGTGGHSPLLIPAVVGGRLLAGHVSATGPITWQAHTLPLPTTQTTLFDAFADQGLWGVTFHDGSVVVADSRDASAWVSVVPPGGGVSYSSAARGKLVAFPAWHLDALQETLDGWGPDRQQPLTLSTGTDNVISVAISDDTLAWIGVKGADWLSGKYDSARSYWAPTSTIEQGPAAIVDGPALPLSPVGRDMDVAGDWMAANGCFPNAKSAGDCRVMLIQRSTQQVYLLKPPDGIFWTLLALSPTEALLAESDVSDASSTLWLSRITRIAAKSFPTWVAPL